MKIEIEKFDFQSNRILSSLSMMDRELFIQTGDQLIFKKKKLIFYEGGIPTGVFLIQEGRAKIYKTGLDGKDQIFYIYKAGDLLGYHALLCNEQYEDSCEALEECKVLFVSESKFHNLLEQIPSLKLLLIQNMSHEFGVLVNTITVLAQKPLRERLALYLMILEEKYRSDQPGIVLPREDLANIVGTARESLGRLLKEFKEEALISIENKEIQILDAAKLQKIASSQYI
ncbi:MAG: Crp/Fnr family transcriptional regulator [Cyclobacteriaceae bacterium]